MPFQANRWMPYCSILYSIKSKSDYGKVLENLVCQFSSSFFDNLSRFKFHLCRYHNKAVCWAWQHLKGGKHINRTFQVNIGCFYWMPSWGTDFYSIPKDVCGWGLRLLGLKEKLITQWFWIIYLVHSFHHFATIYKA